MITLRPRVKKSELRAVENTLGILARKFGMAMTPLNGLGPMLDELLTAGAVKRRRLAAKLGAALHADPSLAKELPAIASVKKGGPVAEIAALHFIAIRAKGDPKAVAAHLDAVAKIPLARLRVLAGLGNGKGRAPFAKVVAPYLDDPDPALRYWAAYYFRNLADREKGELAPWADPILRRVLDAERARSELVSVEGVRAWKAAVLATKKRPAFVKAAKALLAVTADAGKKKKLREVLRETLPEVLG